jgi:topoisomerase IA-like protein
MKQYKLTVNVGDIIEVGRFRNVATKIKNIKLDENGQPVIITSKGAKKLLSCRLAKLHPGSKTPKQILMEKRK